MAIGFDRTGGERFVIIAPDGKESWILVREGRARLAFDLPAGYRVLREEVYRRGARPKVEMIRPAIAAPQESPLNGTMFQGPKGNL